MTINNRRLVRWVLPIALTTVLGATLTTLTVYGQEQQIPQQGVSDVSMTLYHVVRGENGQELFVTPGGQAYPLPGAGVAGHRVAIYKGSGGEQWYVDSTGQQVVLPPEAPASGGAYSGYAVYGHGGGDHGGGHGGGGHRGGGGGHGGGGHRGGGGGHGGGGHRGGGGHGRR